jgi:hypothetical protein
MASPRRPKSMAFHHGEKQAAWCFALPRFALKRKGLTCRAESRKAHWRQPKFWQGGDVFGEKSG